MDAAPKGRIKELSYSLGPTAYLASSQVANSAPVLKAPT